MKFSAPVLIAVSALSFTVGTPMPAAHMQSSAAPQSGTPAQTPSAAPSSAQTPPTGARYLQIEYMKVPAGGDAAYLQLEQEWKPVHQERIRAGKIAWWALYGVRFPGGTGLEYDYVTVTAFNRFQDMENSLPQDVVTKALQGKDATDFFNRTGTARSLVRGEVLELVDQLGQPQGSNS